MSLDAPIRPLASYYDLGQWEYLRLLPGGKSQHWHLVTDRGQYVLRRSYRQKTLPGVRFEHELLHHLRAAGFPAVEPVATVDGDAGVVLDGRVNSVSVFVDGTPYRTDDPAQLDEVARALATYHGLVRSFAPAAPVPTGPFVHDTLRARLAELPAPETVARRVAAHPDRAEAAVLVESLRYALAEGEAALAGLDRLYPHLPITIVHGGCRRGSVFFGGGRLLAMLDYDSAREEARILDLVVAVHDFAKIYGDPASPDFKVHLDPEVAARFVAAYRSAEELTEAELEAVPLLLVAKRLKRALGRYRRLGAGEPLSATDLRKIVLELDRVRSLEARPLEPALRTA